MITKDVFCTLIFQWPPKWHCEGPAGSPGPPLPNSQPHSPPLCSLAHKVGPCAAVQATILRVISLKNSLLPTSFLCRVMRRSSASCCLSSSLVPISGMPHETATPEQRQMWPEVVLQQRSSHAGAEISPRPGPELQSQLTGTERTRTVQSESGWSTRKKHEVPASWLSANDSFPNAHSPPLPLIPPQCHGGSTVLEKLNKVLPPDGIVLLITH